MLDRVWLLRATVLVGLVSIGFSLHAIQPKTIVDRFAKLSYTDENTWSRNQWLGIPAWQNPNDAWIIQEIIAETRPDYIVETGTFHGGSALLWAMVLREVNPNGRVITVDIEDKSRKAREMNLFKQMGTFLLGSSTDPKIVSEIVARVKGKKTVVILDSDHHRDHVLREMEIYSPLVNVGSYLIVQDSNVNGHPVLSNYGPGPMEAIESFLASHQDFQPDASRERFLYTTNPKGYLKRLK